MSRLLNVCNWQALQLIFFNRPFGPEALSKCRDAAAWMARTPRQADWVADMTFDALRSEHDEQMR